MCDDYSLGRFASAHGCSHYLCERRQYFLMMKAGRDGNICLCRLIKMVMFCEFFIIWFNKLLNTKLRKNRWGLQGARHLVLRCRRACHYVLFFSCNKQFSPVSGVANGAAQLFEQWWWPLVMEVNHIYFSVRSPHGLLTLCCAVVRTKLQYAAAVWNSVTFCNACKLQFVSLCLHMRFKKIIKICDH
jgi:hypothetical protein